MVHCPQQPLGNGTFVGVIDPGVAIALTDLENLFHEELQAVSVDET